MSRRGFSLVELVVVLAILLVLTPLVWKFLAMSEDQAAIGAFHLRVADAATTVSEQLALDRRAGDGCDVAYRVTDGVLRREDSCAGPRALARNVERFTPTEGGFELVFALPLRPDRVERVPLFIGAPR